MFLYLKSDIRVFKTVNQKLAWCVLFWLEKWHLYNVTGEQCQFRGELRHSSFSCVILFKLKISVSYELDLVKNIFIKTTHTLIDF